jgi:hypothetical protein
MSVTAQTNLALPRQQELVYFEMTIRKQDTNTLLAVGLAKRKFKSDKYPGKVQGSVGYWSDGNSWVWSGKEALSTAHNSLPYKQGDTVGIGYMRGSNSVFFTHNGTLMYTTELLYEEPLFPTVSSNGPCELIINIGQDDYLYKVATANGTFAARPYSLPPYEEAKDNTAMLSPSLSIVDEVPEDSKEP